MLEAFSVTDARRKFLPLIERVSEEPYRFMITKHGKPVAVAISYEEYARMTETLKLLEDREMAHLIRQGSADAERGDMIALADGSECDE